MRKIPIRWLDGPESYTDVFIQVLQAPANGANTTPAEMRLTVPLIDSLRAFDPEKIDETSEIMLEEAEWEILAQRLENYKGYARNGRDLLDMVESVLNAPRIQVTEVKDTG